MSCPICEREPCERSCRCLETKLQALDAETNELAKARYKLQIANGELGLRVGSLEEALRDYAKGIDAAEKIIEQCGTTAALTTAHVQAADKWLENWRKKPL